MTGSPAKPKHHPIDDLETVDRSPAALDFLRDSRLLPAFEFARLIGVAPSTELAMRSRGHTPPFLKVGSAIFYHYADVSRWMEKRRKDNSHRIKASAASEATADDILGGSS